MAIATLMGTCGIFLLLGWTGHGYTAVALSVGAVVCIAASNAGTTSQDLKTGYLVGATPWKQQVALIIGVLATVFVVGYVVIFLNRNFTETKPVTIAAPLPADPAAPTQVGPDHATYRLRRVRGDATVPNGTYLADESGAVRYQVVEGIGSEKAAAPQARLMSLVIEGILTRQLPWGLVLIGVFLSILLELVGVPALAFAVGVYLPLESTTPVFIGGVVSWLVQRGRGEQVEGDSGPGVLFSSGLIAGGSLMGLAYAALQPEKFEHLRNMLNLGKFLPSGLTQGPMVGLLTFLFITWLLYRAGRLGEGAVAAHPRA
jgi:uncharacterized oligopeptide transporter (OPT) family protein